MVIVPAPAQQCQCRLPQRQLCVGRRTNASVALPAPAAAPPSTGASFANTGTATSGDVTDPQPANNSTTVNVKVGSAACSAPAGQPTVSGVVAWKFYDSSGFLAGFHMYGNDGVQYT